MKVLTKLFLFLMFLTACSNKDKKFNSLDYMELKGNDINTISLVGSTVESAGLTDQLIDRGEKEKLAIPLDRDILYYRFYISEEGDVDSVEAINNDEILSDADEANIQVMKKWKFSSQDEKPVRFDFVYTKNKIEKDVYKKIAPPDELISLNKKYRDTLSKFPEIEGGVEALASLIQYPDEAKETGVQGVVFIRAFLNEQGLVEKLMVTRGIGSGCDIAALTAVSKTKFTPATVEGEPVNVQVIVPIKFKLSDK